MFPYKDENPTLHPPIVTVALIAINAAVWVLIQGMGSEQYLAESICRMGLVPGRLTGAIEPGTYTMLTEELGCRVGAYPSLVTLFTSMFLHGGWLHLIGNMWFLWVFGNNVEDSTGHVRFTLFYLLTGVAAALAQVAVSRRSPVPMVGASGAISGVMGAYIILYPKVRVHMLVFLGFFITRIAVPAYLMLGYWFLLQLLGGLPSIADEAGGVAFWAHAGGFVAGMLGIAAFKNRRLIEARVRAHDLGTFARSG
ncbi:MAG: rhomboid family intramembrane serine protease [Gemmatimonadales bacterium]